jgi:HlyD family secretion protein
MLLGGACAVAALHLTPGAGPANNAAQPAAVAQPAEVQWVAAAPGRVEPKSGQMRIGTGLPGRIIEILVRVNDRVVEGDLLIRLDDVEARARLAAAGAEAAARKRERDAQPATSGRDDVRRAEDAVFAAERAITNARFELDDLSAADRKGGGGAQARADATKRLADARTRLKQEQALYAVAQAKGGVPDPNRFEAGLAAARAEVAMAEAVLDKTRIRAPAPGSVLQVNAKVGELVTPAPDTPLVVLGDISVLRVRAEVDEHDVAKIKLHQRAFVRNNAYPGRDFEGRVTELAPSLAPPRMGSRGARRATDVEVLEVLIELDSAAPLLPGMRAEVFFRR